MKRALPAGASPPGQPLQAFCSPGAGPSLQEPSWVGGRHAGTRLTHRCTPVLTRLPPSPEAAPTTVHYQPAALGVPWWATPHFLEQTGWWGTSHHGYSPRTAQGPSLSGQQPPHSSFLRRQAINHSQSLPQKMSEGRRAGLSDRGRRGADMRQSLASTVTAGPCSQQTAGKGRLSRRD